MGGKKKLGFAGVAAKYGGFAVTAVRQQGWRYGLAEFASELAFDWRHDARTLRPRDLDCLSAPASVRADGVQYQGASPRLSAALLGGLPETARRGAFVDLGCGKGRGLILGAEAGFTRVIGVEFAPELLEDCRDNLRRARCLSRVATELYLMDAAEFIPPPGPLVVFLYNPFQGRTMARVVARLRDHADTRAEVRVVYINPVCRDEFVAAGFVETARRERRGRVLGASFLLGSAA